MSATTDRQEREVAASLSTRVLARELRSRMTQTATDDPDRWTEGQWVKIAGRIVDPEVRTTSGGGFWGVRAQLLLAAGHRPGDMVRVDHWNSRRLLHLSGASVEIEGVVTLEAWRTPVLNVEKVRVQCRTQADSNSRVVNAQ